MKQLHITVQTPAGDQHLAVPRNLQNLHLADILRKSSFALNTRCGGRGLCDGCLVQLQSGQVLHHQTKLPPAANATHIRACEYTLAGDNIRLAIPARSLLAYEPQVVSSFKLNISRSHDPIWRAIELSPADLAGSDLRQALSRKLDNDPVTLDDHLAADLLSRAHTSPLVVAVENLESGWCVTGTLPHLPPAPLGIAIDIGTTTVALLAVDLLTGKIVASASGFNRQMHMGDDVLTRINLCTTDKSMIERLQGAVVKDTVERLLLKALKEANITDERIACITVAANTTMLHLFAGVDPSPMGFAPFPAPFLHHKTFSSHQVHLRLSSPASAPQNGNGIIAADPTIHLLPSAASYVGADLTAGVISSGLAYDPGPSLLVDVGTNGEIIFKSENQLWGCATAAGPAFEGSRMAGGMRAGQGAISHIQIQKTPAGLKIATEVIGDMKPTGICGSAYVDFIAQARQAGLLSPTGRFEAGIADDRIGPYRDLGRCFTVAFGHGNEPIVISEQDIASLLQAKAAIAAGILTLLKRVNIAPAQIKTLYLAGGFGMHLDIPNTIASGLLPGFTVPQIQLVGNTSLAGAYLSMLDCGILDEVKRVAKSIQIVELNLDPDFEMTYIDQLGLP